MADQSAVSDRVELTLVGKQRLQAELDDLRQTIRPTLMERIRQARLFLAPDTATGIVDVSERDLAIVNDRIAELEAILANAQVIGGGEIPPTVQLGFPVTVQYGDGKRQTLTIVSSLEADPSRGYISNDSPAEALFGKAPNSTVDVGTGDDALSLTVLQIGKQDAQLEAGAITEDA